VSLTAARPVLRILELKASGVAPFAWGSLIGIGGGVVWRPILWSDACFRDLDAFRAVVRPDAMGLRAIACRSHDAHRHLREELIETGCSARVLPPSSGQTGVGWQSAMAIALRVTEFVGHVFALSRLKHGFESRWGHHFQKPVSMRVWSAFGL
jgi:hypothetical protein